MEMDLLHPDPLEEAKKHKLKRLIPNPKSFFMDVKCPGCYSIATVFSHAQTVVLCGSCNVMLCQPTGGKCKLTEGCSFRKKVEGAERAPAVPLFPLEEIDGRRQEALAGEG
ncbi:ribosomal protein rps27 [Cyclospora cayetanensis]|uniref:Ribosomal protein rps27 n=2 Tax=Cyclospora cayetanensis TaxID=88456 RepID=A0A1D3CSA3_9EIME|nr:ribosomal protein rps27 [Cyclospora cayetanensis]